MVVGITTDPNRKLPKTRIDDEIRFVAIRLAKAGYFGGDPAEVMAAPVDIVEAIVSYEIFEAEFERAYIDLNKGNAA